MKSETTSSPLEYVFVYGTLRHSGSNAWRMNGATFLSTATAKGHLYCVDWYPAAIFDNSAAKNIIGEHYSLSPDQLQTLDIFEGAEYLRVRIPIISEAQHTHAWAWEYLEPVKNLHPILSGDWLKRE